MLFIYCFFRSIAVSLPEIVVRPSRKLLSQLGQYEGFRLNSVFAYDIRRCTILQTGALQDQTVVFRKHH